MDKKLAKELIRTRKAVKEKLQSLKYDATQSQADMGKMYEPLTKIIQTLVKTEPKEEEKPIKSERFSIDPQSHYESPQINQPEFLTQEETFIHLPEDLYIDDTVSSEQLRGNIHELSQSYGFNEYLDQFEGPLARQYVEGLILDVENNFDSVYGVKFSPINDQFTIGDSILDFKGNNIIVKSPNNSTVQYEGSVGLYELLFKRNPQGYFQKDLDDYIDIVKRTNAARRNNDPKQQVIGSRATKYTKIIGPAFKTGRGLLMDYSNRKIEFRHWDDPNELVDRLKLLIASEMAGNSGVHNEIISIVEELREANIIK